MNLTTDSPTAKKNSKKILGRKSLIQKTDGEYPTSNSDDEKSDSKKSLSIWIVLLVQNNNKKSKVKDSM